ncbi:hypothetical protein LMH87_010823 [Akanthomyces muscarius]|uniref:Uncharacterized protein n=1 Tax=Akanthomyces muscarius TaxID=2231603 RepID=A0A9W8Q8I8_AKAMU|nr:hypothetical protein LMH87_010823 [Akanthomyces muscarius]KAJ4150056.1 hypothetical protein LMH87_010823 [Akanthomyces muscarius]
MALVHGRTSSGTRKSLNTTSYSLKPQAAPAPYISKKKKIKLQHSLAPRHKSAATMGLGFSRHFGGKHFGSSIWVDKNGVRRGPFRFSFCGWSCFKN